MTTYYSIDSMPFSDGDKERIFLRLDRIWYDGTRGVMNTYEFLESLMTSDDEFVFSRTVDAYDEFFASTHVELPNGVQNRLEQTVADLAVIATALRNMKVNFGYTHPTTQEETN